MDTLLRDFKKMSELDQKEVTRVIYKGAKTIRDAARANVRVHSETVAQAYDFITKKDSTYPTTKLIGIKGGNTLGTKTITAPALASILEFGSVERFKKDGSSTGFVKPSPWLRPAIDTNAQSVMGGIKEGLLQIIEKQAIKNKLI
jgi:hypothetical protein